MTRTMLAALVACTLAAAPAAQVGPDQDEARNCPAGVPVDRRSRQGRRRHADVEYAPAEPATSNGHKLDLYLPAGITGRVPVVIWTGGSAWMADTGKRTAPGLAVQLLPAGYAVAGVSIRSSSQVEFPGQLHDIKAAIRWLRATPRSTSSTRSDRHHGRQLRRLDDGDGGADR